MNEASVQDGYRVELFGTVHAASCVKARRGMVWAWEGRNNLAGDKACPDCLPDGLPDREPHQFSPSEAAALRSLAQSAAPAGDADA